MPHDEAAAVLPAKEPKWTDLEQHIARAMAAEHYAERFKLPVDHVAVQTNIDGNWVIFLDKAVTAVKAVKSAPGFDLVPGNKMDDLRSAAAQARGLLGAFLASPRNPQRASEKQYALFEEIEGKLRAALEAFREVDGG